MDFSPNRKPEQQVDRPVAQSTASQPVSAGNSGGKKVMAVVVAAVVAVLVLVGVWYFAFNGKTDAAPNKDDYQAVFLTNGQVYFGKLQDVNGNYLSLSDVYYLQVNQTLQPKGGDSDKDNAAANANSDSELKLVKLGNEIHGPEDQMQISAKQVLFWENLKDDGKVVQAIANYQKK